jgi:hypothetical protein
MQACLCQPVGISQGALCVVSHLITSCRVPGGRCQGGASFVFCLLLLGLLDCAVEIPMRSCCGTRMLFGVSQGWQQVSNCVITFNKVLGCRCVACLMSRLWSLVVVGVGTWDPRAQLPWCAHPALCGTGCAAGVQPPCYTNVCQSPTVLTLCAPVGDCWCVWGGERLLCVLLWAREGCTLPHGQQQSVC